MKKTMAFLIAVVLTLTLALPAIAADGTGTLILGSADFIEAGDEKTISVKVENLSEVSVIQFVVKYDSTKLELLGVEDKTIAGETVPVVVGAEIGTLLEGLDPLISEPEKGSVSILWESTTDTISGTGDIAKLRFRAIEDGVGKAGVVISDDEDDEFIFKEDSQDETGAGDIIADVEEDKIIEDKYTVTFDATKGTGAPEEIKSVLGEVKIPEEEPTLENWIFLYWFDEDGSYEPGNTYAISEDKVLKAAWAPTWEPKITIGTIKGDPGKTVGVDVNISGSAEAPSEYSLTFTAGKAEFVNFEKNGAAVPVSGKLGTAYFKIPADAKDGATYTVSAQAEKWIIDGAYPLEEKMTITSGKITVERSTFNVTYDANRGTGAPAVQIKNRGEALVLTNTQPTRPGYKFIGWANTATATTAQYQPGASYSTDADLTLYAVWEELPVPKIIVGEDRGRAGELVEVPIYISNNPGYAGMDLKIKYDDTVLELTEIRLDKFPSSSMASVTSGKISGGDSKDITGDGTMFVAVFKIKETAADGKSLIDIEIYESYNINDEDVEFIVSAGEVEIYSYIIGDANGDGKVSSRDITRILQYLVDELGDNKIDLEAADFNRDGKVSSRDITKILEYLVE